MRTDTKDFLQDLMDFVETSLERADNSAHAEDHILAAYGTLLAVRERVKAQSPQLNTQLELLGLCDATKELLPLRESEYAEKMMWLKDAVTAYRKAIQKAAVNQPYRRLGDDPWPNLGPNIYHSS